MKILNPIALVSWHIFGSISLADVGATFFVRRKLKGVSIHGPGALIIGGSTELIGCTFFNCDFIAATERDKFQTPLDANNLKADGVWFSRLIIITTQDVIDGIHKTRRKESEDMVGGTGIEPVTFKTTKACRLHLDNMRVHRPRIAHSQTHYVFRQLPR